MGGEKGVKNMCFQARLGNQSIDFSDFWYVTSLIYYFKYGIGSFARKKNFGPKNGVKGVKNALLTDILVDKAYLVTIELQIKLHLIVIEQFVYSKFDVNYYIVNLTSMII